jgi:hypothetical protein
MRKVDRRWVGVLLTVVLSLGGLGLLVQADCVCVDDDCYEDVIVSGAGSIGVNHTYVFTKMAYDKPFYGTQASGSYITWVVNTWKMYSDLSLRYYSSDDSPTPPPPPSWGISGLGDEPAPTAVTGGEACSCGPTITVSAISGPTTEAGGTATFTLTPAPAPTADVTIPLSSSNTGEGTVPVSVVLPSGSTDPVTVTVTGVDDDVDDGDIGYSIVTAVAISTDSEYSGLNADDVSVTNTDDDAVGITVTPTTGLTTTEAGGTDTFTVVLDTEPTDTVTIDVSSDDATEGTVDKATLTFTTSNWATPQSVTITGQDDAVNDGNIGYTIDTAAATGGDYTGLDADDVSVTNSDDEVAFTLTILPAGNAGPELFLDVVLPVPEGEDLPMAGLLPLAAIHVVGDVVSGGSMILDQSGLALWASFVHVYVYSVDITMDPEVSTLIVHWTCTYDWVTGEYPFSWDTTDLEPGYYDLYLVFEDGTTQIFRIQLTLPVE